VLCVRPAAEPPTAPLDATVPDPIVTEDLAHTFGLAFLRSQHPDATEEELHEKWGGLFGPEIIDGHSVEAAAKDVMLDIECSPVLPRRASRIPCQAVALDDGRYRVYLNGAEHEARRFYGEPVTDVTAEELRVMRARYLLVRGALYRELHLMPPRVRANVEALYFPGGVFVPAPGSRMADVVATGQPLSIPLKEGESHLQVMAGLLAEAGAEDMRLVVADGEKLYALPIVPSMLPVPVAPPAAPDWIECEFCETMTPGGICDSCIRMAADLELDLDELRRKRGPCTKARRRAPAPPAEPRPPRGPVEIPEGAVVPEHGGACWFGRLNDLSVLDVTRLPAGFGLCAEHWERVRKAQGGAFRRPARHREYAGDRYRD
jgi:hypothetical protein